MNHGLRKGGKRGKRERAEEAEEGGWFVFLNMSVLCWISTHYSLQPSFNSREAECFLVVFLLSA